MKKVLSFFLLIVFFSVSVYSQNNKGKAIFGDDYEKIMAEIKVKIENFQHDVNKLAGKELSRDRKIKRYHTTLQLFIGEGDAYMEIDAISHDTSMHPPVTMTTAPSKNKSALRKTEPLKEYLLNLIDAGKRKQIEILSSVPLVSEVRPDPSGENRYVCVARYLQQYTVYNSVDGTSRTYWDYTGKSVIVYIDYVKKPQEDGTNRTYWIVKLGDVDSEYVY